MPDKDATVPLLTPKTRTVLVVIGVGGIVLLGAVLVATSILLRREPDFYKAVQVPSDSRKRAKVVEKRFKKAAKELVNTGTTRFEISEEELNSVLFEDNILRRLRPQSSDLRVKIGDGELLIGWKEKRFGMQTIVHAKVRPSLTKDGDVYLDLVAPGVGALSLSSDRIKQIVGEKNLVLSPSDYFPVSVRVTKFVCAKGRVALEMQLKEGEAHTIRIRR